MSQSKQFRFFLLSCITLSIVNLLAMNDVATAWNGAEARLLFSGLEGGDPYFPPTYVQSLLTGDLQFNLFLSRLPGVLLMLAAAATFHLIGRKIFGEQTTILTILTWSATIALPNVGKIATADSWLFFFQLVGWTTTLRFLKQPRELWRILTFIALLFALWLDPLSTLPLFGLGGWILFRFHPDGYRLRLINPWIVLAAGAAVLFSLGQWHWGRPTFLFGWFSGSFPRFALVALLSFLPVWGFLLAGLRDVFQKLRKKEELAIIASAWLIGGLAGQSLLLIAGLGLLVAKQLMLYFQKNYPHRNLVRTGALLHLIAAFCGVTVLLLFSFGTFGGVGFRSALAVGAAYWTLSFVSVIGLYGLNRRLVWAGGLLSGIFLSLFFWLQYYPLIEGQRNWPQRLESVARKMDLGVQSKLYIHQLPAVEKDKASLYCEPHFRRIVYTEDVEQLLEFYRNDPHSAFFIPRRTLEALPTVNDTLPVKGWTDHFEKMDYLLIRN